MWWDIHFVFCLIGLEHRGGKNKDGEDVSGRKEGKFATGRDDEGLYPLLLQCAVAKVANIFVAVCTGLCGGGRGVSEGVVSAE